MAKRQRKRMTMVEALEEMTSRGTEVSIPGTDRLVRLRTLDAPTLLREGKMPDILTPLVIKSVYEELSDKEVRGFLSQSRGSKEEALATMEAIDFIVERTIVDNTKVKNLTLGERRWIFRLVMGPAEILTTFRYDPDADVEPVVEGNEIQSATEPDTEG